MRTAPLPHRQDSQLTRALTEINARDIAQEFLGEPSVQKANYDQYSVRVDDDTPSFTVYRDGFKDFGRSGAYGGTLAMVEYLGRMTRQQSIDFVLRRWRGELLAPATAYAARSQADAPRLEDAEHLRGYVQATQRRLQARSGERARDYLRNSRQLTNEVISRYGFTPAGTTVKTPQGKMWMPAGIVIPRFDTDGKLIAVHTRRVVGEVARALGLPEETDPKTGNIVAKYMTRGAPSDDVYGAGVLRRPGLQWIIFVEGEFDCDLLQARLDAIGAPVAVVTKGSASGRLSKHTLDALRSTGAPVAVLLDTDSAGQQGAADLIDELHKAGLPHTKLPNLWEQKDVTDAARARVDIAGAVLTALHDSVVQPGKDVASREPGSRPAADSSASPEYSRTAASEGAPEKPDASGRCRHMTIGLRQALRAGFQTRENCPLLIEWAVEHPGLTASELEARTGISRANISTIMTELVREGLIRKELCLRSSPNNDKGDVAKHNSSGGRKSVIVFSASVPKTEAEREAWVAFFERKWRKNAPAHVAQSKRSALELIDEAKLKVPDPYAIAEARASIDPAQHDSHAEREIQERVGLLRRALKNTSLAAVLPMANRKEYTTACMQEHFDAVPQASKKEHARALGVSVENLNTSIRRHGFQPNETKVEETLLAGDARRVLPAVLKQRRARMILSTGTFGATLSMPTFAQIEEAFYPDEQITVYMRGVNTYTYTGVCLSPKKNRIEMPASLDADDVQDIMPQETPKETPAQ